MDDSRRSRWYRQRKKRGFDDRELCNFDHTIAKFVLPRLLSFKENKIVYPADLTMEMWDNILDGIIYSMQAICDEWAGADMDLDFFISNDKKVRKGLKLFGEYFRNLWW